MNGIDFASLVLENENASDGIKRQARLIHILVAGRMVSMGRQFMGEEHPIEVVEPYKESLGNALRLCPEGQEAVAPSDLIKFLKEFVPDLTPEIDQKVKSIVPST